jgi:hypothetical protein
VTKLCGHADDISQILPAVKAGNSAAS